MVWVSGLSFLCFIVSLAALPWMVARIPDDYFTRGREHACGFRVEKVLAAGGRNLLGLVVFFLGIIMLFIPGQGLLTMLLGIVLMDFPGKRRVIFFLVKGEKVRKSLNWIRRKKGKPPLRFPDSPQK